ncbi:MAG: methionyl-tRNA formyltransferase, partial [Candidatus Omnitrophota bacterium]
IDVLERLLSAGYEICCVVTQPDRKAGRHLKVSPVPVKLFCEKHNFSLFQPEALASQETRDYLKKINADLFVVVSYGKIIPKQIIELPKIFSLNVHASLLPKYRGAAPINRAIMNAEQETGISIIKMNEFMDRGEIILQKAMKISDSDDAQTLSGSLAKLAADAIIEAIELIKNKKYTLKKQNEKEATLALKLIKEDGLIDWSKNAKDIFNQIRGLIPWPGAYTYFGVKLLKVWKAIYLDFKNDKISSLLKPGEVSDITPEGISVCCKDGTLLIQEVQLASSKRMQAYIFALGHKIKSGDVLG